MHQDPARLSTLLTALKVISGEKNALMIVRDDVPRALVVGIGADGEIRFHACAETFTRAIADAHDHARGFDRKGVAHEVQAPANPEPTLTETASPSLSTAAGSAHKSAVVLIPIVSALKSFLGPDIPAVAAQLFTELENKTVQIAAQEPVLLIDMKGVMAMPVIFNGLLDLESKLEDIKSYSELKDTEGHRSTINSIEGAQAIVKSIFESITG